MEEQRISDRLDSLEITVTSHGKIIYGAEIAMAKLHGIALAMKISASVIVAIFILLCSATLWYMQVRNTELTTVADALQKLTIIVSVQQNRLSSDHDLIEHIDATTRATRTVQKDRNEEAVK